MSITVTRKVHFSTGLAGQKRLRKGTARKIPATRVPRISRLMALAIHFDQLIRGGKVKDYAELARLGHVTRARVTQIMNMLALAPDIQEALLHLEPTTGGHTAAMARHLRPLLSQENWQAQRKRWLALAQTRGALADAT
jgi:hypothetical protein